MAAVWPGGGHDAERLAGWQKNWMTRVANPANLLATLGAAMSGGAAGLPVMPGMGEAPDTSPIVDAASDVIDQLNRVFAGPGIPVARALAAEAIELGKLLEKPELMAAINVSTREEMLKKLGLAVTADVARTERVVTQYVLAVMELEKVQDTKLPMYIVALNQLGTNISWERLLGGNSARSGRGASRDASVIAKSGGTY